MGSIWRSPLTNNLKGRRKGIVQNGQKYLKWKFHIDRSRPHLFSSIGEWKRTGVCRVKLAAIAFHSHIGGFHIWPPSSADFVPFVCILGTPSPLECGRGRHIYKYIYILKPPFMAHRHETRQSEGGKVLLFPVCKGRLPQPRTSAKTSKILSESAWMWICRKYRDCLF